MRSLASPICRRSLALVRYTTRASSRMRRSCRCCSSLRVPKRCGNARRRASSFTARVSPRCMRSVSSLRPSIFSGASSSRASTSSRSTTSSTDAKSPTTLLSRIRSRRSWPVCWLPRLPSTGGCFRASIRRCKFDSRWAGAGATRQRCCCYRSWRISQSGRNCATAFRTTTCESWRPTARINSSPRFATTNSTTRSSIR